MQKRRRVSPVTTSLTVGGFDMTNKVEMVSVPRELLERALSAIEQVGYQDKFIDYTFTGEVKRELESLEVCRSQPEEYEIRTLYRRPQPPVVTQCSEVSQQCSEHLRKQGKLLPTHTLLPHPPRHEGFLQPEREVPGYTAEQMKEYGAACAAEALRQNK